MKLFQKYIFKIKNTELIKDGIVLINTLFQDIEFLNSNIDTQLFNNFNFYEDPYDYYRRNFYRKDKIKLDGYCLDFELNYLKIEEIGSESVVFEIKYPIVVLKVESEAVEAIEVFHKFFSESIGENGSNFSDLKIIYDGISDYYSTQIYSRIHYIERKTEELFHELHYIKKDCINLRSPISKEKVTLNEKIEALCSSGKKSNSDEGLWDGIGSSYSLTSRKDIQDQLNRVRKIRNIVAHCREVSREDFEQYKEEIEKLDSILKNTICNIENSDHPIIISDEVLRELNSMSQSDSDC